jgi:hypothetical protein
MYASQVHRRIDLGRVVDGWKALLDGVAGDLAVAEDVRLHWRLVVRAGPVVVSSLLE